jgi:hypothetical protein
VVFYGRNPNSATSEFWSVAIMVEGLSPCGQKVFWLQFFEKKLSEKSYQGKVIRKSYQEKSYQDTQSNIGSYQEE